MEDSGGIRGVSFEESLGVYRYGLRVTCKLGIGLCIGALWDTTMGWLIMSDVNTLNRAVNFTLRGQ